MCTAVTYKTKDFYFGRTLDYDCSYGEEIVVTPRNFPFEFSNSEDIKAHYAIIGTAHVRDDYPLYYDAVNEEGLCIAGLNFVGNADYKDPMEGRDNIAQFEFIPWMLFQCADVKEARALLGKINIIKTPFSETLPPAQLHWIIADREEAITVESVKTGMKVYDNHNGVLTNNPTFDKQLLNLNKYIHLSPRNPENFVSESLGMGALGLPGDFSSRSRFVKAAFVKMNAVSGETEEESVGQFFHILGSVSQPRGSNITENGNYEITIYTSCYNADRGIYYYKTYDNHRITAVAMHNENLDTAELIRYPMISRSGFLMQN